ncbi:MAG: glycoside hydrolase family 2 TIM barrel-domain containing protein [Bacteroidota bacterium]|nr:glycoside hydrolase family 2 TIM barrel-domain containing protein [Bacteroidota bacterium]
MKRPILILLLAVTFGIFGNYTQVYAQMDDGFTPKPYSVSGISQALISLNGQWDFNPAPPVNFWKKTRAKQLEWESIQVPGEWVMQGFSVEPGTPAAYAKRIIIPADWKGKRIILKCDGVYSLSKVYLNGKLAGQHEGGFTPFEVDLTKFAKPGRENEFILSVQNESQADTLASATQYAAHQLGGITRKLEIFAVPETCIRALNVTTDLDEDYEDAMLTANIQISIADQKSFQSLRVKMILKDPIGNDIVMDKSYSLSFSQLLENDNQILTMPVIKPALWDPEHPSLYDLFIILEADGEIIEKVQHKIGFREIETVGNQVFVNGSPIKLRGVNRHEVHPTKGRSLSMDEWRADAQLFKEANVNYIRTSHYPPAEEFIALCDSIGLFVECEAPLCWVGHGANETWRTNNPHDNKFYSVIRQQVMETVAQYRNHPSVIIWSMANESTWGVPWQRVLEEVNHVDPTRPVSFHDQGYGGYNNYGSKNTQIANMHYPGPGGPAVAWKFDRPLLFGEYAHLNTYNRQEIVTDPGVRDAWGRGLESMWENMYNSTGCLGGAIWSGVDDIFYLPSGKAVGYGEWGPIDGWRRPKPEYWHLKKIYSPVKIVTRTLTRSKPGKPILIPLENRNLFTNMNEINIVWSAGEQYGSATMDLGPGSSGILRIWTDGNLDETRFLELSFTSPQGILLDKYSLNFEEDYAESKKSSYPKEPVLQVLERKASVIVGNTEWVFDAPTGKIRDIIKNNKVILEGGPELFLIPLKTGPCNTEHSLDIEPHNDPCENWNGKISGTGKEGNTVYIEVEGSYKEADVKLRYSFDTSALVTIDYEITAREAINPRQIGLIFVMPGSFDQLSWKRKGQWSVYPDTHIGRPSGTATPFPKGILSTQKFGGTPSWRWEEDTHPMGSNDFRATRDRLIEASLTDSDGDGIRMHSDGSGAFRAFVNGTKIHFLSASFSTAGGDLFFSSHLAAERHPLKKGEIWKGQIRIELL